MTRLLLSLLLIAVIYLPHAHALVWETCRDGNYCPENPTGKAIGGRNGYCPVCNTEPILNSTDTDLIAWLVAKNITEEPLGCSAFYSDCICRPVGETCYSDFGAMIDVWILLSACAHAYLIYLCVGFMIEIQAKRKPKAKVSAMEKIVLMVFTGCVLRFLWFIVILPGRHGSVVWGGAVLEGILLKVPQILWMGAFFFMASTWKTLADQAASMKKSNPKEQAAMDFKINAINMFMIFLLIPMYILGSVGGIAAMNALVNLCQMIIIMGLMGSSNFGFKLAKELGPDAELGKMIKQCCIQAIGCASTMIVGLILNLAGMTQGSPTTIFLFWMTVHIPEIVAAQTLLITKIQQKKKVIKDTKGSSAQTTTSTASVAPEG